MAQKAATAINVANLLIDRIINRYGFPKTLLTDWGQNYASNLVRAVCHKANIKKVFSNPYQPSTNGIAERLNSSLGLALHMVCEKKRRSWDLWISTVQACYNQIPHKATGCSPHELLYGYSYPTTTDVVFQLSNDAPLPVDQENCKELVFEKMEALRKVASAHADTYREKVQEQANQ